MVFGLFNLNANIIIPNIVGLTFSLCLIILYRVYKNKKPLTEELNNISHTVIGAVKNVVDKTVEIANSITPTGAQNKTITEETNNTEQGFKINDITNNNTNVNTNIENNDKITINENGVNNLPII